MPHSLRERPAGPGLARAHEADRARSFAPRRAAASGGRGAKADARHVARAGGRGAAHEELVGRQGLVDEPIGSRRRDEAARRRIARERPRLVVGVEDGRASESPGETTARDRAGRRRRGSRRSARRARERGQLSRPAAAQPRSGGDFVGARARAVRDDDLAARPTTRATGRRLPRPARPDHEAALARDRDAAAAEARPGRPGRRCSRRGSRPPSRGMRQLTAPSSRASGVSSSTREAALFLEGGGEVHPAHPEGAEEDERLRRARGRDARVGGLDARGAEELAEDAGLIEWRTGRPATPRIGMVTHSSGGSRISSSMGLPEGTMGRTFSSMSRMHSTRAGLPLARGPRRGPRGTPPRSWRGSP